MLTNTKKVRDRVSVGNPANPNEYVEGTVLSVEGTGFDARYGVAWDDNSFPNVMWSASDLEEPVSLKTRKLAEQHFANR